MNTCKIVKKEVIQYIKMTLRLLDRCAVPGLGEFKFIKTGNDKEKNTTDTYRLILEPYDENKYSMLTACIRVNENIPEELVTEKIKRYVGEVKTELHNNKTVTLDILGKLSLSESGEVLFDSCLFPENKIDNCCPIDNIEKKPENTDSPVIMAEIKNETEDTANPVRDGMESEELFPGEENENIAEPHSHSLHLLSPSKAMRHKNRSLFLSFSALFTFILIVQPNLKKPSRTNNAASLSLKESTITRPPIDKTVSASFIDTAEILVIITNTTTPSTEGIPRKRRPAKYR